MRPIAPTTSHAPLGRYNRSMNWLDGVGAWYLLTSLAAFIAYARDKRAARRGDWRTSEATLQLLALIGGWPGALAGQAAFRHKIRKRAFTLTLWLIIALHVASWAGVLVMVEPWA